MIYDYEEIITNMFDNMKAIAAEKRIMMKELAEAADITPRTLRNYFNGVYDMPVIVAIHIAGRLGYKISGLMQYRAK